MAKLCRIHLDSRRINSLNEGQIMATSQRESNEVPTWPSFIFGDLCSHWNKVMKSHWVRNWIHHYSLYIPLNPPLSPVGFSHWNWVFPSGEKRGSPKRWDRAQKEATKELESSSIRVPGCRLWGRSTWCGKQLGFLSGYTMVYPLVNKPVDPEKSPIFRGN
jgi:hypothetical protein